MWGGGGGVGGLVQATHDPGRGQYVTCVSVLCYLCVCVLCCRCINCMSGYSVLTMYCIVTRANLFVYRYYVNCVQLLLTVYCVNCVHVC